MLTWRTSLPHVVGKHLRTKANVQVPKSPFFMVRSSGANFICTNPVGQFKLHCLAVAYLELAWADR